MKTVLYPFYQCHTLTSNSIIVNVGILIEVINYVLAPPTIITVQTSGGYWHRKMLSAKTSFLVTPCACAAGG
jgi:hypothetical protein